MSRILWVDDDYQMLMGLVRPLEHEGHVIDSVRDMASALEKIRAGTAYELAIIDILLPFEKSAQVNVPKHITLFGNHAGTGLIAHLRKELGLRIPIVVMSVLASDSQVKSQLGPYEISDFLSKGGISPTQVQETVNRVLDEINPERATVLNLRFGNHEERRVGLIAASRMKPALKLRQALVDLRSSETDPELCKLADSILEEYPSEEQLISVLIIQQKEPMGQESASPGYDVFLSHNSTDKPAVELLARRLADAGIRPWLDKWNLVPGEPWQEAIEEALDACQTVAVFLGPKGIGPWENEEMRSALETRIRDKSRRVILVLLPGAPDRRDRPLPRFLARLTWVDFRGGLDNGDAFHRLISGIRGQSPGPASTTTQLEQVEPTQPPPQENDIAGRLEYFGLDDETDPAFGHNELTKDLLQAQRSLTSPAHLKTQRATSWVVFLVIPSVLIETGKMTIIKAARELFDPNRWYDTNRPGPRYHAREAFPLAEHKIRTGRNGVVTERMLERPDQNLLMDVLQVNQFAEVAYATSYHAFDEFVEGTRIFRLGAIINFFWSFLCMVWELYENIGYSGNAHACIAMVNTKDSLLGNFAQGWPDPYKPRSRTPFGRLSPDEICRDPNILVCRDVDFTAFQPKVEPDVLYQVAEEIALAYNQTEVRCFEQNTRKLMEYRFHN